MDVKQVLLDSCDVIIREFPPGANPLDTLYETMKQDIWLHFDSAKLFIFKDNDKVHLPINIMTKTSVLNMILWLIESRSMMENIRNSDNRILFRVYKGNARLDSSDNAIRNELWLSLVCNVDQELTYGDVWKYLALKRVEVMDELEKMEINDSTEDLYQSKSIEHLRLISTLKYFEELASRSIQTC
jgi:hypothetical protein